MDAIAEALLGVFEEAETEASHVNLGGSEPGRTTGDLEKRLLGGKAHVAEAEDSSDEEQVLRFLDNGDDGEVLRAADVNANEEGEAGD